MNNADNMENGNNGNNNNKKKSNRPSLPKTPLRKQLVRRQPPRKCNITCFECGLCVPKDTACVCKTCNWAWHIACLPAMFEKHYSSRRVAGKNWMCKSCSNASRPGRKKPATADQMAANAN